MSKSTVTALAVTVATVVGVMVAWHYLAPASLKAHTGTA